MVGTITASSTLTTTNATASDYKFVVDRRDNGNATIILEHREQIGTDAKGNPILDWVVAKDAKGTAIQQTNAGWDDAIPWGQKTYTMQFAGTFAGCTASWKFIDNPADRFGIRLHQGNQSDPSGVLEGCIGATANFLLGAQGVLDAAKVLNSNIAIEVNNDFNYAINIQAADTSIKEGQDTTFTISLTGAGAANGLSKDLFVRLNIDKIGSGLATYGTDYTITPVTAGGEIKPNLAAQNDGTARYDAGLYVLIPKGQSSVTYKIHSITDSVTVPAEGNEKIDLTINDYFVRQNHNGHVYNYSDSLLQPGVLLKGTLPNAPITIVDQGKLLSEHISGDIKGLQRTFQVTKGDVITFGFEAYSIPDKLSITDGAGHEVGTGGFVSNFHTGSITAGSDQISVIVVGSDVGTAWDLDLTDSGPSHGLPSNSIAMFDAAMFDAGSSTTFPGDQELAQPSSAIGAAATGTPSLVQQLNQAITVPSFGETSGTTFAAKAGKDYLVRLVGFEATSKTADIHDGYLKVFEPGTVNPVVENHQSNVNGEAAAFFHASADTTVTIKAGSDISGSGGTATLQVFDASALQAPIVFLGQDQTLTGLEGGDSEIAISVYRFGDVTKAASYKLNVAGSGSKALSASDLTTGFQPLTVSFAAGQSYASALLVPVADGLLEGSETGTVSIDPTSLPGDSLANAAVLGLASAVTITVQDGVDFGSLVVPTLSVASSQGYEGLGHVVFDLQLSQAPTNSVTVAYTTADGIAVAGSDYVGTSGTVTFAAGETLKHIDIQIANDGLAEGDENFQLELLNANGLLLQDPSGVVTVTGTIHDGLPKPHWLASVDIGLHPAGYTISGIGDFNHDGTSDVLWYNPATRDTDIWSLNNGHWAASTTIGLHPAGYDLAGIGDFNRDGTSDVLWFNPATRDTDIWLVNNGHWAASTTIGLRPDSYQIAGIGDFNHDGTSDVLWFNPATRDTDIWLVNNGHWAASTTIGVRPDGYRIAGIGDFNHDGTSDVLWVNPATNDTDIWLVNNGHWAASTTIGAHPAGYQVAGIGDFNQDGTSDVVWANPSNNDIDVWLVNNGHWAGSAAIGAHPLGSALAGVGDFDHNGVSDVMWRDPSNHVETWLVAYS